MKHRASARKRFLPVSADVELPASGTSVTLGEAPIGNSNRSIDRQGLALIRLDRLGEAKEAVADGVIIRIGAPAYRSICLKETTHDAASRIRRRARRAESGCVLRQDFGPARLQARDGIHAARRSATAPITPTSGYKCRPTAARRASVTACISPSRHRAKTRSMRFTLRRLKAGGKDEGAPGPRPDYGPDYYGAFCRDLDGTRSKPWSSR